MQQKEAESNPEEMRRDEWPDDTRRRGDTKGKEKNKQWQIAESRITRNHVLQNRLTCKKKHAELGDHAGTIKLARRNKLH